MIFLSVARQVCVWFPGEEVCPQPPVAEGPGAALAWLLAPASLEAFLDIDPGGPVLGSGLSFWLLALLLTC